MPVEINSRPERLDPPRRLLSLAVEMGCRFAIDSDAHSGGELAYAEIGVAHARLAGVPADRVVNTWPLDRLLEWAAHRL